LSLPEALLAERRAVLSNQLRSQPRLRITSAAGTDFSVQVAAQTGHGSDQARDWQLRMGGRLAVPVVRATAQGSVVLDGGLSSGYTSEVVRLEFADGRLAKAERSGRPAGTNAGPDPLVDSLLATLAARSDPVELLAISYGVNPAAAVSSCYDETSSVAGYCRLELGTPATETANHRRAPQSAGATKPLGGIAAMCHLSGHE
jgi:hypothetical protein